MEFVKKYLRAQRKLLCCSILFALLFICSFLLYHLPLEAALYPIVVCAVLEIFILTYDGIKEKRKWELLKRETQTIAVSEFLAPEPQNAVEEVYQELVRQNKEQQIETMLYSKEQYRQLLEYFTLWVHQIKTPISSMRLILETEDSELTRRTRSELRRIEQYVSMVLTYLRLDFDHTDYVLKEYTIDELVRPVIRGLSAEFIGRKLALIYEPIEYVLVTDEKWFSLVVEQILSNALKYTKTGEIEITMEEDELIIRDTGIGIDAKDLPRVFEKGYTGYNGRMDKRASGIGLYLCKRICDNLKMPIRIQSEINVGTKVRIMLRQSQINFSE